MPANTISRTALINITVVVEALLLLIATAWSYQDSLPLLPAFKLALRPILIGIATGAIMSLCGFLIFLLGKSFKPFSQLKDIVENMMIPLISELNYLDILLIASVSAFCEEVFFRGIVMPKFNLWLAALGFGLFHDPSLKYIFYVVLACAYGIVLGLLYKFTSNLWAPILAHFVHNLISMYIVRYKLKPPVQPAN